MTVRLERRLDQPWWLNVAVPAGSLAVAFGIMGIVLVASEPAGTATLSHHGWSSRRSSRTVIRAPRPP